MSMGTQKNGEVAQDLLKMLGPWGLAWASPNTVVGMNTTAFPFLENTLDNSQKSRYTLINGKTISDEQKMP
jgi:hypothetical protein